MKKLMFAAAVAALSTATMAADGIVSSSVVGYQNKELKADYAFNLTVATFKVIDKDTTAMTLGDIKPSADWMGGSDEILILSNNGAVQSRYTYMNATDAADWGFTEGWYITDEYNDADLDLTELNKNSTVLPMGNGVVALVGSSATTLTCVGEGGRADTDESQKAVAHRKKFAVLAVGREVFNGLVLNILRQIPSSGASPLGRIRLMDVGVRLVDRAVGEQRLDLVLTRHPAVAGSDFTKGHRRLLLADWLERRDREIKSIVRFQFLVLVADIYTNLFCGEVGWLARNENMALEETVINVIWGNKNWEI